MDLTHVDGESRGRILLFALSTCVWCRKTRKLLDRSGVAYDYVYVDRLSGDARTEALEEMKRHNPLSSFPTVVIDGTVISGHDPERLREVLGLEG
jgi:glutaredoxin